MNRQRSRRITQSRASIVAALMLGAWVAASGGVSAQPYPTRPIRLTVGFPPGGNADFASRVIAGKLSRSLGANIVVENRTGAGGSIAVQIVTRAQPDGYTLLWASTGALTVAPIFTKNIGYSIDRSFTPIGLAFTFGNAIVTRQDAPVKSVAHLIALAKERPKQINFGSQGVAAAGHLSLELFQLLAGISVTHVPYKGAGELTTAILGGELPYAFMSTLAARSMHPRARALAVTTLQRDASLPDVPTLDEAGVKGYDATFWFGLLAPAGLPLPIRDLLNKHLRDALADEEAMKTMHATQGLSRLPSSPDEFVERMRGDSAKWRKALNAS
jgi:tripartite-type tricarboxylate transporter receptor subunit TctC